MKKYDRGWASLETGAALLIVMLLIAWGAGIWQDYIQTKGWQTEARLVSNWTSAARSYIGKNYTTLQGSSTTTTPAVITTTMLKNTGFLSSGFTETNSEGQRLQAYVVRNAQNPELLQAMVVSSGGTPYPVKALIQMAKDITTGLGGYIQDGKTATGALRSWSVALSNYGAKSGNGHIAVLLSTDELSGAAEDTDRLYRFQVNGRPDLNKMHTAIDMGSNNLNNVGAVNAQTGNFSGNVNGVNGTFSGQVKGNSGNFDVNVTAGGDIRSNNGWLITRNSKGWLNETHGGGFYMSDGSWVRSVNSKGIYTGGQVKGGTPPLGTITSADEQLLSKTSTPQDALIKPTEKFGQWLTNNIATEWTDSGTSSNQVNPLIKMKNIGDKTMVAAEGIWITYTSARVITSGTGSSIFGKFIDLTTSAISTLNALLEALAPPVYFLLLLLFCAGFSLSIYLPFIPFIFWMTGIGNWVISVLIGCTAGPLWGATHLGTSQDRGSRAAYGYIYLIDSMIRPPIMVFGFFFASVAIIAIGTILNFLFGAALTNVQISSFTGIFSLAGFLLLYARSCTTIVAAAFALQAYLPDHVINFLGGRDGVNTLGNMAGSIKEIFAGSNRNIRHAPNIREEQIKRMNNDNNKDGIKG